MNEPGKYFLRPIVPKNNDYYSYSEESECSDSKTNVTLHFKPDGTYDSEHTESDDIRDKDKIKNKSKIRKRGRRPKEVKDTEEARRQRNRVSAVMCRLRKKQRIEENNKYIQELEDTLNNMKEYNQKIQIENEKLRKELIELRISLETKTQMINIFLEKGFRL